MIGTHLNDEEIQCIVDKTIEKMDMDGDGCIDLEEFERVSIVNGSDNYARFRG